MDVNEYLDKVAYIKEVQIDLDDGLSKCYFSKFDDSYMSYVGQEQNLKWMADLEIIEELQHGVGFSPKDNKWYGWSHRAYCGFEVGSTCKKGDWHYRASCEEEEIEDAIRFCSDPGHINVKARVIKPGLLHVSWIYDDDVTNEDLRDTIGGVDWEYDPNGFGKGEWTAQTMEDAKQMAIDFNRGVS